MQNIMSELTKKQYEAYRKYEQRIYELSKTMKGLFLIQI